MSVNDPLDKLQRSLLDFFFPRRCPFCGRVVGKALLCGLLMRSQRNGTQSFKVSSIT